MMKFELYHLFSFVLLYLYTTNNVYKINLPKIKLNNAIYTSSLLVPLIAVVSNKNKLGIEQTIVIMSYIIFIYALPQVITLSETEINKHNDVVRFAHPLMIVLALMLLYSQTVDQKYMFPMYSGLIAFSLLSVAAGKIDLKYIFNDYVLCHLIFFFTKQ